jgi:transposase
MGEGKLPKRQYKGEFKAQAVKLAASVGGHEAARRPGVPVATLGICMRHSQPSKSISCHCAYRSSCDRTKVNSASRVASRVRLSAAL